MVQGACGTPRVFYKSQICFFNKELLRLLLIPNYLNKAILQYAIFNLIFLYMSSIIKKMPQKYVINTKNQIFHLSGSLTKKM